MKFALVLINSELKHEEGHDGISIYSPQSEMKLNSGSVSLKKLQKVKLKLKLICQSYKQQLKCEMRACGVFFLIYVARVVTQATSAGGPCDKIESFNWYSFGILKTCYMQSTAIDSKDFSITSDRDVTVEAFQAFYNKNLKHLPNNLGAKFPNLVILSVQAGSIKEISKDNFEGLSKLRNLDLQHNQIAKIDDDTFEYIPAVEEIWLYDNKIKKLNGRAFASLHKLTTVWLNGNECIDENFTTARIAEMSRIVSEKCGFADNELMNHPQRKPLSPKLT